MRRVGAPVQARCLSEQVSRLVEFGLRLLLSHRSRWCRAHLRVGGAVHQIFGAPGALAPAALGLPGQGRRVTPRRWVHTPLLARAHVSALPHACKLSRLLLVGCGQLIRLRAIDGPFWATLAVHPAALLGPRHRCGSSVHARARACFHLTEGRRHDRRRQWRWCRAVDQRFGAQRAALPQALDDPADVHVPIVVAPILARGRDGDLSAK
mmetsp:Transcript_13868/g.36796  ORF Transcript_13868/g.36796 Transcript_13868/m.36796 type:complete len:209 (-) Transcript_13868:303-929(-)